MPVYYNEFKDSPAKYYQNKNTGRVIGVVDGFVSSMYFYYSSPRIKNELIQMSYDLEKEGYVKIVPPKTGDIILLKVNNINSFSPHVCHKFKVEEVNDFFVIMTNIETNENLAIDIRNWVWENTTPKEKVIPDIKSGDIIEKDGKKYKIILEEYIPPPKYKIGEIIGDGNVIVNTSCSGTTRYYTIYLKHEDELHMKSESEIESLK